MKRTILVMFIGLYGMVAGAQTYDRVVNVNPLRNGDGSFMKANNPLYFDNRAADTIWSKKASLAGTAVSSDPYAFRINSIQALCDPNSLRLNWTTIQHQADADHFDIEQSADGGVSWTNIGTLPATRTRLGEVPYDFDYNKSLGNVDLRVVAVNTAGERRSSAVVHSACSNTNLLSVDNLVYSTANVRIGSPKTQTVKMVLVNQSGRPVLAREAGLTQGVNSISLDMSQLPRGFYVLTIVWPGGREDSVKMMKQ